MESEDSSWGIGPGITLAIMSGATALFFNTTLPNPDLAPLINLVAGLGATIGIGLGIKYDFFDKRDTNHSDVKVRRVPREPNYVQTPENVLARRRSTSMTRFLDKNNKRENYVGGLRAGANMVQTYLRNLSSEEYSSVKQINIFPEQQTKIFGLPFGRKSLEVKIKRC